MIQTNIYFTNEKTWPRVIVCGKIEIKLYIYIKKLSILRYKFKEFEIFLFGGL